MGLEVDPETLLVEQLNAQLSLFGCTVRRGARVMENHASEKKCFSPPLLRLAAFGSEPAAPDVPVWQLFYTPSHVNDSYCWSSQGAEHSLMKCITDCLLSSIPYNVVYLLQQALVTVNTASVAVNIVSRPFREPQ